MARELSCLMMLLVPGFAWAGVTINELMPNPSASADGPEEWVELYNDTASGVDVGGWQIEVRTSSSRLGTWDLPGGTVVPARGFLVVGGSAVPERDVTLADGHFELGNASSSGDLVRLLDGSGTVVDTVIYGPNNSDGFLQDDGVVATSVVRAPSPGQSIGRVPDGVDTQVSGDDLERLAAPSPGASNAPPPPSCDLAIDARGVVINEFVADVAGSDDGLEWVEIVSGASRTLDLGGWRLEAGTSSWGEVAVVSEGTTLGIGRYLLVGGASVPGADVLLDGTLPNASNADGLRLVDCAGDPVDTVIYGSPNDDGWLDDQGAVATSLAPRPVADTSLARAVDGGDTDRSGTDFVVQAVLTPGAANPEPPPCEVGDLVINELLVDPDGADAGLEWVELYNPGDVPITVAGWVLAAGTSGYGEGDVLPDVEVPAGGHLLLGGELVPEVDVVVPISLGNGGASSDPNSDGVQLRDCEGAVVDSVVYSAPNNDGFVDDTGQVATSLAPRPTSGASLARLEDGYDTQRSALDFVVEVAPTPGASNPVREPVVCSPASGETVVLNELMVNPDGDDAGAEWVELYNPTGADISVAGWGLAAAASGEDLDNIDATFPGGSVVPAGGFLVLGDTLVDEADVVAALSLGNGSGGDGLILYDCEGTRIDGILYGPSNEDGVLDDQGQAVDSYITTVSSGSSLARVRDGGDSDAAIDWFSDNTPSPGASNRQEGSGGPEPGGCGRRDRTPDAPTEPGSGCGRSAAPRTMGVFLLLGLAIGRRQRRRGASASR